MIFSLNPTKWSFFIEALKISFNLHFFQNPTSIIVFTLRVNDAPIFHPSFSQDFNYLLQGFNTKVEKLSFAFSNLFDNHLVLKNFGRVDHCQYQLSYRNRCIVILFHQEKQSRRKIQGCKSSLPKQMAKVNLKN